MTDPISTLGFTRNRLHLFGRPIIAPENDRQGIPSKTLVGEDIVHYVTQNQDEAS